MSLYSPPPNISVGEGLYLIFSHYCTPWKSQDYNQDSNFQSMDGASFNRMCKEGKISQQPSLLNRRITDTNVKCILFLAPELTQYIGRTDIDLIFSKSKPQGTRRLDYDHFLDSLLELSVRIFPDDDPTIALANFLAKFIFALFDQPPAGNDVIVIEKILGQLAVMS